MNPEHVRDRGGPSDHRHGSLVEVLERRKRLLPAHPPRDHLSRIRSLLHRDLGHALKRLAVGAGGEIADHEDVGMAGQREVCTDLQLSRPVRRGVRALRQQFRERGHPHAAGPEDSASFDSLGPCSVGGLQHEALLVDLLHHHARLHLYAQPGERLRGLAREVLRERREHPRGAVDEEDPRLLRVDRAEVVPQGLPRDLADRAGQLHAGRPRADDDERQPGAPPGRIGEALGDLEGVEDLVPDGERLFDALQARRPLAPFLMPVIGALRPGRDDQGVVRERGAVGQHDVPCGRIDVHHFAEQNARVLLAPENAPQGRSDVACGQGPGCHLVEQRLEDVMVAPIDERHVDRRRFQRTCRPKSAKSAADDHHLLIHGSPCPLPCQDFAMGAVVLNFVKSGRRLWKKASNASFASGERTRAANKRICGLSPGPGGFLAKSSRSLPAVNESPAPWRSRTRVPSSFAAVSRTSARATYMAEVIAFFFAGRLNCTLTTLPDRSVMISFIVRLRPLPS